MKYIALLAAILGCCLFFVDSVSASGWTEHNTQIVVDAPITYQWHDYECFSTEVMMDIIGEGWRAGCYEENESIAVGTHHVHGKWRTVMRPPYSEKFYPIDGVCAAEIRCRYVAATDTLIAQFYYQGSRKTVLYRDFSSSVVFNADTQKFSLKQTIHPETIGDLDGYFLAIDAYAISDNGRWMFADRLGAGFVAVDLQNVRVQEVSGETFSKNPLLGVKYTLAISNDGNTMVVGGQGVEFTTIVRTAGCGTTLDTMHLELPSCETSRLRLDEQSWSLREVYMPKFSPDSAALRLFVYGSTGSRLVHIQNTDVTTSQMTYIAFGDSFASGEGELDDSYYLPHTNTSSNTCHVSSRSYPYLLASMHAIVPGSVENRACSGSTMKEVSNVLPTIIRDTPRFITLSVGGNDAGLMHKLKDCVAPGTCSWAYEEHRAKTYGELTALRPKLLSYYKTLANMSPKTSVNIVGYPLIVNQYRSCGFEGVMLNTIEREFMNEALMQLNRVILSAAQESGVQYRDMESVFDGHRLCDQSYNTAMNGLRTGDDIAPIEVLPEIYIFGAESYHPTPFGHQLIADRLYSKNLNEYVLCGGTSICTSSSSHLDPTSYWPQDSEVRSRFVPTALKNEISVPDYTFSPYAPLTITQKNLAASKFEADYIANEHGGFQLHVAAPVSQSNVHTYTVSGTDISGELLELYGEVIVDTGATPPYPAPDPVQDEPGIVTPDTSAPSADPGGFTNPPSGSGPTNPNEIGANESGGHASVSGDGSENTQSGSGDPKSPPGDIATSPPTNMRDEQASPHSANQSPRPSVEVAHGVTALQAPVQDSVLRNEEASVRGMSVRGIDNTGTIDRVAQTYWGHIEGLGEQMVRSPCWIWLLILLALLTTILVGYSIYRARKMRRRNGL